MKTINKNEKVLKSGVFRMTFWEFRPLDKYGDTIDPQICDSVVEAMDYTKDALGSYDGECVAWVMEKHVAYCPAHLAPGESDKYTTLATGGDHAALLEGGWVE